MDRQRASKARQQLLEVEAGRGAQVEQLLKAGAMVEGAFVEVGRKCGKPTCRCVEGERHFGKYLSRSIDGRKKMTYVRGKDEVEIGAKAESYRRFRRARAELMKLAARAAELADELQRALTESYPRDVRSRSTKTRSPSPKGRSK